MNEMKKVTVWTNDFTCDKAKEQEVKEELEKGTAVRICSDCIGHTRSAMVKYQGEKYLKGIGAKLFEEDYFGNYYTL